MKTSTPKPSLHDMFAHVPLENEHNSPLPKISILVLASSTYLKVLSMNPYSIELLSQFMFADTKKRITVICIYQDYPIKYLEILENYF